MKKLLTLLILLAATQAASAATVYGRIENIIGDARTNTVVLIPRGTPYFIGDTLVGGGPVTLNTDGNGDWSTYLYAGDYTAIYNGRDRINFSVPPGEGSYTVRSLTTSGLTYVYRIPPATSSTLAGMGDVRDADLAAIGQAIVKRSDGFWGPGTVVDGVGSTNYQPASTRLTAIAAAGLVDGAGTMIISNSTFKGAFEGIPGGTNDLIGLTQSTNVWANDIRNAAGTGAPGFSQGLTLGGVTRTDWPTGSTTSSNWAALTVNDDAYGAGWNGSTNVPTKNALYDKIEGLGTGGGSATNIFGIDIDAFSTNNTDTCIWTNSVPADSAQRVLVQVVGAGPTNAASYNLDGMFRRTSGNVSKVSTNNVSTMESDANLHAWLSEDTTNVKLWVKGPASEQFHWLAKGWSWSLTNHATTVSACSTTDTTLPHDTLLEGFQLASNGYGDGNSFTTTEVGTTANIDSYADSSALASGKPDGACDRAWKLTVPTDGTETYVYYDLGSSIDTDTVMINVVFYLWVEAGSMDANGESCFVMQLGNGTTPGTSETCRINLKNSGGNIQLEAGAASTTTATTITTGAWHKVALHIDTTNTSCSLTIDDGTTYTFQRGAFDVRYLFFGASQNLGAGENGTLWFDLITINTP
jgi:hypothetical protein